MLKKKGKINDAVIEIFIMNLLRAVRHSLETNHKKSIPFYSADA